MRFRYPLLVAALALIIAAPARSEIFRKDIRYFNPDGVEPVTAQRPAFADLNADGLLDLVIGDYHGRLILYWNTGTPAAPVWTQDLAAFDYVTISEIGGPPFAAPAFADLDADGDLDLAVGVVGTSTLTDLVVFRNVGSHTQPSWREDKTVISISEGENVIPTFGDVDADGDPDLILGDVDGSLHYYRNVGTPQQGRWTEVPLMLFDYDLKDKSSPLLFDIDGDGDLDIVVGNQQGEVWLVPNIGTRTAPAWGVATNAPFAGIDVGETANPWVADIDADGMSELAVGRWESALILFDNDGTFDAPSWRQSATRFAGIDAGRLSAPTMGDLNGDGALDIVVGERGKRGNPANLSAYRNAGTNASPIWVPEPAYVAGIDLELEYAVPRLADLDGDGLLDLVLGALDGRFYHYRNTGTAAAPAWTYNRDLFIGIDVGNRSVPAFADLDGDGDLDLVAGEDIGVVNLVENTGSPIAPQFTWVDADTAVFRGIDVGANSAPAFGDLDGDGDLDMTIAEGRVTKGKLFLYENTGTVRTPAWRRRDGFFAAVDYDLDYYPMPEIVWFPGDARAALITGEESGGLKVFRDIFLPALPRIAITELAPANGAAQYDSVSFFVNARLNGPNGVTTATVLWDTDGEIAATSRAIAMQNTSGDRWRSALAIPRLRAGTPFVYAVRAIDATRDTVTSATISVPIVDDDTEPPTFGALGVTYSVDSSVVWLSVEIRDRSGVYDDASSSEGQGVYLRWTSGNTPASSGEVRLSRLSGDTYRIDTPIPVADGGERTIVVTAHDNDVDTGSPDDRTMGSTEARVIVLQVPKTAGQGPDDDVTGPTFGSMLPVIAPDSAGVALRVVITDSSGVFDDATGSDGQGAYIRWDIDGEVEATGTEIQLQPASGSVFTTVTRVPAQRAGTTITWRAYARDDDYDGGILADRMPGTSRDATVSVYDDDIAGPAIVGLTPRVTMVGNAITLRALITDPSGIYDDETAGDGQGVFARWDTDGELQTTYHVVAFAHAAGDTFRAVAPLMLDEPGIITYEVNAWDNDADGGYADDRTSGRSGLRTLSFVLANDDDVEGPTFSAFSPTTRTDAAPFPVRVVVTDPSGVYDDETGSEAQGAYLWWDTDGELSQDYHEVQLVRVAGDTFTTVTPIPAQAAGSQVICQAFAWDNDVDGGYATDRALSASFASAIIISDDDAAGPTFSAFDPDTSATPSFAVTVKIDDPSGVYDGTNGSDTAAKLPRILWDVDGELTQDANSILLIRFAGSTFRTEFPVQIPVTDGIVTYQVFAYDNDADDDRAADRASATSLVKRVVIGQGTVSSAGDNVGPVFVPIPPPRVAAGTSIVLTMVITDPLGVYDDETGSDGQGAFLWWDTDGEVTHDANEVTLVRVSGDTFTVAGPLPPQTQNAHITIAAVAWDGPHIAAGSRARGVSTPFVITVGAPLATVRFCNFAPDTVAPGVPIYVTVDMAGPSGVYDNATGPEGWGAYLLWDTDGEVANTARVLLINRVPGADSTYRVVEPIPAQPAGTVITYAVVAADNRTSSQRYRYTSATATLRVGQLGNGRIIDLAAAPNPFPDADGNALRLFLLTDGLSRLRIEIYTIAAQRIRVIDNPSPSPAPDGYSTVIWDGLTDGGDEVANGVYIVRVVSIGSVESDARLIKVTRMR